MTKNIVAAAILLCSVSPQIASCQNTSHIINNINVQLKEGKTTITKILSSDSLMYLHALTPFREVIKANAKAGRISIVTDKEPGTRITVTGLVVNKKNNEPKKNVLIYFYHTDDKGWIPVFMCSPIPAILNTPVYLVPENK